MNTAQPLNSDQPVSAPPHLSEPADRSDDHLPPPPTFIIIGAQKCATRWLRVHLGAHPAICTAPTEVKYFNHPKRCEQLGLTWYRRQFSGWSGETVLGEATPGYMMWRHDPERVAERILRSLPNVRLIALLRHPVERAQSALIHHARQQRVHPSVRLVDWVNHTRPEDDWLGVVAGGWYARSLQPYAERFGDRLLTLLDIDIRNDPRSVYERALMHVGASTSFVPPNLHERHASNRAAPEAAGRTISVADHERLMNLYLDDIAQLERLLNRDLSAWRRAGPSIG